MKPFISIEFGVNNMLHIEIYLNMPSGCEEDYRFESKNDFYTNLSLGSVFFPEQTLSFVVGLKYQITSPEIKYKNQIVMLMEGGVLIPIPNLRRT